MNGIDLVRLKNVLVTRRRRGAAIDDAVQLRERFYRSIRLCQAWEDMPQVTVAAMEGLTVGASVAIAPACDGVFWLRTPISMFRK